MIYNQDLTDALIDIFGVRVLTWSKNSIRNEIEDLVIQYEKAYLADNTNKNHRDYNRVKALDDVFTELYIEELDNIKN